MKNIKIKLFDGEQEICSVCLTEGFRGELTDAILEAMTKRAFNQLKQKIQEENRNYII